MSGAGAVAAETKGGGEAQAHDANADIRPWVQIGEAAAAVIAKTGAAMMREMRG